MYIEIKIFEKSLTDSDSEQVKSQVVFNCRLVLGQNSEGG